MIEKATKVATTTIEALKSTPLAIALLAVNLSFLVFAGYVLRQVGSNAQERSKVQMELISEMVRNLSDACRNK